MRIGNSWVTGKVVSVGLDITSSGNVFKSYRVKSGDNIYFGLSNSLSCVVGEEVSLRAYVSGLPRQELPIVIPMTSPTAELISLMAGMTSILAETSPDQ